MAQHARHYGSPFQAALAWLALAAVGVWSGIRPPRRGKHAAVEPIWPDLDPDSDPAGFGADEAWAGTLRSMNETPTVRTEVRA